MTHRPFLLICCLLLAATANAAEPDFAHDVAPLLRKACGECHAGKEAKGGFSINTRASFLDDDRVLPGKADESLLLELVNSSDPDSQMPPKGKPRLKPKQIAVLKAWIDSGVAWESGFSFAKSTYEPPLQPRAVTLPPVVEGRSNPIDRIIDAYLIKENVPRPEALSDTAFVRRVYFDLIGLPPTIEELQAFQQNTGSDKRAQLVSKLLDDDVRYAEHWLTFWNDLLRNDYAGTGFITKGRTQISGWLYEALIANKPYDEFAQELIAPTSPGARGFIDGIKWRGTVSAAQSLEVQFAQSISQSFLGINMKCASCHDSFVDRWKLKEAYGLAAIYANAPLPIYRCDKPTGESATAAWIFPELGAIDPKASQPDRLKQLAALMTDPQNGRFTRTIVNRLWSQMMGRGVVHPVDAMQTEPWSHDLLDYLANHLQENNYDLKATLALIANSAAYQSQTELVASGDEPVRYIYRGPRAKRLTAEEFVDTLWRITGQAPTRFDAPIQRGKVTAEQVSRIKPSGRWIWGDSAKKGTPPAGESLALRFTLHLKEPITAAGAVATCDNRFTLFVNNQQVADSGAWEQLQSIALTGRLRPGENTFIALVKNEGASPNPAGFYFQAQLQTPSGPMTVISDNHWEFTDAPPKGPVNKWKLNQIKWRPCTELAPLSAWSKAIDPAVPGALAQAAVSTPRMVRASLLRSDFLMRSLGRPNRDQIVTSRPSELTTLEAIDLSNDQTLANWLAAGGKRWAGRSWRSTDDLVNELFLATLSRRPTSAETATVKESLSDTPTAQELEDVLWALCMSPEFFFR